MKKVIFWMCGALLVISGACRTAPAAGEAVPLLAGVLGVLREYPDTNAELLARRRAEEVSAADYGRYVIVARSIDAYEGGAHGMATVEYRVFDREAAKVLALADVIPAQARQLTLKNAVEAALRERYGVPEGQGLTSAGFFSDEIGLTENFFLSDQGIGFLWNPYEIAPYAMGAIEVVVPLGE